MKTANAGENWVYLDGQIAKGSQPHSVLIHEVGKHLTGEPVLTQVANTWLAENELPKGLNNPGDPKRHGIARGHYDKRGRPAIWESNADRNHVMDAAYAALEQQKVAARAEQDTYALLSRKSGDDSPWNIDSTHPTLEEAQQAQEDPAQRLVMFPRGEEVHPLGYYKRISKTADIMEEMQRARDEAAKHNGQRVYMPSLVWKTENGLAVECPRLPSTYDINEALASIRQAQPRTPGLTPFAYIDSYIEGGDPVATHQREHVLGEKPREYRGYVSARGYRETAEEMYAKIQGLGWDVLSQGPKNDLYSVTIRDVDGAQIERTGKTQEQAMASALTWAWQHSHMSGHIKDEMDLPIPTQTLGQVMSMLRPNKLDGNHLGLQAHKLGYSFGELQTLLRMEEAEGVQPGWKGFKEAALSAYASRGWKTHTASVELRLFSGGREDGQTGGLEKIEVPDAEEGKRIGYQAMSDGARNVYRAQIWDPLANREVWDSDKDWRQDPPKEEEQRQPRQERGFQQLNLLGTEWVTSSTDWTVTSNEQTPDYMFVYYQGALEVSDYSPNTHSVDMLKRILDLAGKDITDQNVDDNKMSSGEITKRDGEIDVELTNLADLDVQEAALNSVQQWAEGMNLIGPIQVPTDG